MINAHNGNESYYKIVEAINSKGHYVEGTREVEFMPIVIRNPINNIIFDKNRMASPYYMAGELIWYLSASNKLDHINYYSSFWNKISDNGETVRSAYGHRIFSKKWEDNLGCGTDFSQWDRVVEILSKNPNSRQAVIHLNLPHNGQTKDEICTLNLIFSIRDGKLNLTATMRSNDVMYGYTYDMYMFTMFQQIMANRLNVEVGEYRHLANSMHIYDRDIKIATDTISKCDSHLKYCNCMRVNHEFISNIPTLIRIEEEIRTKNEIVKPYDFGVVDKYTRTLLHTINLWCLKKNKRYEDYISYCENYGFEIHDSFSILLNRDLQMIKRKVR